MKFSVERRWTHITAGRPVCAIAAVRCQKEGDVHEENDANIKRLTGRSSRFLPFAVLEPLTKAFKLVWKLIQRALQGFTSRSSNEAKILFYILHRSYIADIPDWKDMVSVKPSARTYSPFYDSVVRKENFISRNAEKRRKLRATPNLLRKLKNGLSPA